MVKHDGRTGTVLVGVDDTSHGWLAADWAAAEAELRGSTLRVVHAVHGITGAEVELVSEGADRQVLDAAATVLDDARTRIAAGHPGLHVETVLARDHPAEALLSAAEDADLLVVGTRGRGGFAGLLLGSVSLKLAAHATCPVVVVRGHAEKKAADGGIVVGVRDEHDENAVRFALAEAELLQAPVRLIHAWTPLVDAGRMIPQVSQVDEERKAHARVLNQAARPVAEYPQVHVDMELVVGAPAALLVEASAGAGLLVLPRHPPAARLGLRLGAVVHAVLHHATCPVAVVPVS
ncbi:universal stress protein [Streptomyces sp. TRM S81-3]|uniref:Universal stress protein n=1 Tax=Streptomyces griseicoloratus TaxID=2752516 RepID=A0A926L802_9ACTN|nr:universal stress protein [Streptomyces griseicoloratus]MBD0422749.1 universal stress protein [Streptomyces griseicoloratus]